MGKELKISIDEALRMLHVKGWNVGDISFDDIWYVHCSRGDESFTAEASSQSEAWEKAARRIVAGDN